MSEPAESELSQPAPYRVIDTAEAIKAVADPLRLRLLQLLMRTTERTWTVKEIATDLTQPVTKLYHHIKLLESAGLITDVESRLVSGIVEHRYRASQRSLRFNDDLFGQPDTRYDSIAQVAAVIDATRDELVDYLYLDDADIDQVMLSRVTVALTPEELAEIDRTVDAMVERYAATRDDPARADLPRSAIVVIKHPLRHGVLSE